MPNPVSQVEERADQGFPSDLVGHADRGAALGRRAGTKTEALVPGREALVPGRFRSRTDPQAPPSQAIDVRGRFRVEAELARGGMGVIYRARDTRMNRVVALKVLLEIHSGDRTVERRFIDEARLTAGLEHPGVVPVFEIGRCVNRQPFFAMGLIEGETLAQVLARRDGLSDLPGLLRQFERVCQAVGHAHSRGVIHRDLKPENVMIGGFGTVKVIDWGIAKHLASGEETENGLILGTPAYLPPEQASGEIGRIDERADVFSLGGILCEILTGKPPYTAESPEVVLDQACAANLGAAFHRLDACGADHELVALVKRCLAARPEDRPRRAGEVEAVIKEYLESDLRRIERDQIRFFDLSLEMFCIAGLDGYFRQINANFPRTLGYSEQELVSRPFMDFVHPDDIGPTNGAMANLGEGREVVRFPNRYRHADGHYVWLEWSARAIPEERVIYAVARPWP